MEGIEKRTLDMIIDGVLLVLHIVVAPHQPNLLVLSNKTVKPIGGRSMRFGKNFKDVFLARCPCLIHSHIFPVAHVIF